MGASSLRTAGEILSGPLALPGSRPSRSFWIPGVVKWTSGMSGNFCGLSWSFVRGVSDVKTDWNCWFRMLALSVGFVASSPVVWDSREPIWTFSVLFLFTKDHRLSQGL